MESILKFVRRNIRILMGCLLAIATIFFCGYTIASGLQGDDSYYVLSNSESFTSLIEETLDATVVYYQTWNGRFIVNFINIFIVNCGMVVQTIAVFVILTSVIFSLRRVIRIQLPLGIFTCVLLFTMLVGTDDFLFNSSCLNIVCNYLFPIPFYLFLVKAIVEDRKQYSPGEWLLLCIEAFISGSLIETYSFSLALLVIIMVVTKQFHLNYQKILIGFFYACGALTLLLCPGSLSRSDVLYDGLLGFIYRLNGIVGCFSDWMVLPLLGFVLTMVLTKTTFKSLTRTETALLLYAAVQVLVMCVAPYFPPRALLMVNFILISISLSRLSQLSNNHSILNTTALICAMALCGQLAIAFGRIIFAG